jgi:hypothetical protein
MSGDSTEREPDMSDDELEPPRPKPDDFRVYVQRGSDSVDVTHAVMDVYDIAVGSMDFGSGFLSTEEVGNLRALGKSIGAESFDYQHDKCLRCGHDYERHYRAHSLLFQVASGTSDECDALGFTPTREPVCSCAAFIRPDSA